MKKLLLIVALFGISNVVEGVIKIKNNTSMALTANLGSQGNYYISAGSIFTSKSPVPSLSILYNGKLIYSNSLKSLYTLAGPIDNKGFLIGTSTTTLLPILAQAPISMSCSSGTIWNDNCFKCIPTTCPSGQVLSNCACINAAPTPNGVGH